MLGEGNDRNSKDWPYNFVKRPVLEFTVIQFPVNIFYKDRELVSFYILSCLNRKEYTFLIITISCGSPKEDL